MCIATKEENVVLFTTDRRELNQFTQEALKCAALDSCCSSSVVGSGWLQEYLDSLEDKLRIMIKGPLTSFKVFKFGNSGKLLPEGK